MKYNPQLATPLAIMMRLKELGHYDNPEMPTGVTFSDLPKLSLHSEETKKAIKSYVSWMPYEAEAYSFAEHNRSYHNDGEFGPATERLIFTERCEHPDYHVPELNLYDGYDELNAYEEPPEPAVGHGGNWPRCHNIGNFHAANVNILNSPPAHLARNGNFAEVLRRTTKANAEYGLQFYWTGSGSPIQDGKSGHQLTMQFVNSSSGWIGLAQVASNRPCNSVLWSRYLATYLRTTTNDESVRRMWTVLVMHELGHNMGTGHTHGGIMNPSILSLPATWRGDPLESWLRSRYGGEPIPTNDPEPDPDPDPDDPKPPSEYWLRGTVDLMKGDERIAPYQITPAPRV